MAGFDDDALHEPRNTDGQLGDGQASLGADDLDLGVDLSGVVGPDLGAEAVLERGDDTASVGVVLRVGRGDEDDVEGQPDAVTSDLDVALLEDVEQTHLDPFGEVWQLVDGKDPPVDPRNQSVVES